MFCSSLVVLSLTGALNMHDAVPFTVGEEVKTGERGILTLTGYNRNTIAACYGITFGAELHDAATTLLIVHGAELRDFTRPQLDDFAWLTADELGVVELSLVNFGGKSGFAIGRLKKNYVLLWCISSPGTAVSSFGYDSGGFVACATAGANFIRQNQGLPALTLDHKSNPLKCIQGNTKALFEQAEIALFDRSQKGFIAPSVAGGEKGIRTAYCVDNGDGSLSLSKASAAGADLVIDPKAQGHEGERCCRCSPVRKRSRCCRSVSVYGRAHISAPIRVRRRDRDHEERPAAATI